MTERVLGFCGDAVVSGANVVNRSGIIPGILPAVGFGTIGLDVDDDVELMVAKSVTC